MLTEDKDIHAGHRQRMRAKLLAHGPRIFDTYELLEMLLYYIIPFKDTNPTSKLLLKQFSSLSGVLSADVESLQCVSGIGARAAEYIHDLGELISSLDADLTCECATVLDSYDKVGDYLVEHFSEKRDGEVVILMLDNSMRLIAAQTLYTGVDYDSSRIKANVFVEAVAKSNAAVAITAHNHVFGPCYPTSGDRATDDLISRALGAVGVKYLEHYVVSGSQYIGISKTHISGLHQSAESFFYSSGSADDAVPGGIFARHAERARTLLCRLTCPLIKSDNPEQLIRAVLEKYGTVLNVFSADAYALADIVGESAALAIKLYAYIASRSVTDEFKFGRACNRVEVSEYFKGLYIGSSVETVWMMLFDSKGRAISCECVGEGTVNTSEVLPRKIISCAMNARATSVAIAHNHPFGVAVPSDEDVRLTTSLSSSLLLAGKRLDFHVIIADRSAYIIDCAEQDTNLR